MGSTPLVEHPQIVAANKIDALDEPERLMRLRAHVEQLGLPLHEISAATGEGVPALLEAVWPHVAARLEADRIELEGAAAEPDEASVPPMPAQPRRSARATQRDREREAEGFTRVTTQIDLDGKRDGDA
jgi:50S ribosomal subunit-associated GTPase HflX